MHSLNDWFLIRNFLRKLYPGTGAMGTSWDGTLRRRKMRKELLPGSEEKYGHVRNKEKKNQDWRRFLWCFRGQLMSKSLVKRIWLFGLYLIEPLMFLELELRNVWICLSSICNKSLVICGWYGCLIYIIADLKHICFRFVAKMEMLQSFW